MTSFFDLFKNKQHTMWKYMPVAFICCNMMQMNDFVMPNFLF